MTFCIWAVGLCAQIHGVVIDSDTGDPIPYLNVYYDGKGVGTITDIDGKYSIDYHPVDKVNIFDGGICYTSDNSFF